MTTGTSSDPQMAISATLRVFSSRMDRNGNTYWAFEFIDHTTGKRVCGNLGGSAKGNANFIRYGWSKPGEWDASIQTIDEELPIREFDRLVKTWPYVNCASAEIAQWVRGRLV